MHKNYVVLLLLLFMIFPLINLSARTIDNRHPFVFNDFNKRNPQYNAFQKESFAENLIKKHENAECKTTYIQDNDLHNKGKYFCFEYNVTPEDSEVGYISPFHGLDLTFFKQITFNIKGDLKTGYTDKIKIEIATWNDRISYTLTNISESWQKITINIDDFTGQRENFNWEGVEKISFIIAHNNSEAKKGKIYLDDLTLIPNKETSITLKDLKMQKYIKPLKRLFNFPKNKTKAIDLDQDNKKILQQIANDTWLYFKNIIDRNTYMVMDNITVTRNIKTYSIRDFTNITNIGLQLLVILSAYDLKLIKKEKALNYLDKLLSTIESLETWNGLYYNYYLTKNGKIADKFISSVDNGWLAAGLICLRNSFDKKFYERASKILYQMNFKKLYDPKLGQLYLGYDSKKQSPSRYHYGLLCTEPRVTSLIAIGKKDIPEEHWFRIYRTLPKEWTWQKQIPNGKTKSYKGLEYFNGYYTYKNEKYVPSWGGSMFETLMPVLVVNEKKWAPKSLGKNNEQIVKLTIQYTKDNKLKYWGYSPCSIPDKEGGYSEFGIPVLGTKGYETDNTVTPHAIILALQVYNEDVVMTNLKKLIMDYPEIYGEYGLFDSVNIKTGNITKKYLALDQAMIMISLCNVMNKGSIQNKFEKDKIFKNVKELIASENFFDKVLIKK